MSEAEKRKRAEYRRNRKKWMTCIVAAIALVSIVSLVVSAVYFRTNNRAYTTYTESSKTSYKVNYNPGFKGEAEEGKVYIGEQVDTVRADFDYTLVTDSDDVEFEYEYSIVAEVQLKNRDGVLDTYKDDFVKEIVPPKKKTASGNTLRIRDSVLIDYEAYNNLAKDYIAIHSLENFTDTLIVTLRIDVLSSCDSTEGECTANTYFTALNIPLTEPTFKIDVTESVGEAEKQILDKDKAAAALVFGRLALGGFGLDIVLVLFLLAFAYLTRNTDINYTIKVRKIVSSYKSYIQKITNGFDSEGYQILLVDTFREMLEIRDTIESPILMSENEDCTLTRFLIPTGTKLLYVYEIKVDNYHELYAMNEPSGESEDLLEEITVEEITEQEAIEEPKEDVTPEAVSFENEAAEELTEKTSDEEPSLEEKEEKIPVFSMPSAPATLLKSSEAKAQAFSGLAIFPKEEPIAEEGEEQNALIPEDIILDADGFDSGAMTKYDYSFESRLALSDEESRGYYSDIIAFVKSYGVKVSRSWKRERIYFGRKTYANFVFKAGRLSLAFALDPSVQDEKYGFIDMRGSGKFAKTPSLMKLTSNRKRKYATDLLSEMFASDGVENKMLGIQPEYVPYVTRNELFRLKLIKAGDGTDIEAPEHLNVHPGDENKAASKALKNDINSASTSEKHEGTEHHILKLDNVEVEVLELEDIVVKDADIEAAVAAPDVELSAIDYDEDTEPIEEKEEDNESGVEVVGVVWPEKVKHNKIYRYDPNGETLREGDVVLAPTRDAARNKDIVRKVAVAHANHKVAPEELKHPLKKIIGIVKRKAEGMLTPSDEKVERLLSEKKRDGK